MTLKTNLITINGGRYKPSWIKMNLKLDNDNEFENDFETRMEGLNAKGQRREKLSTLNRPVQKLNKLM